MSEPQSRRASSTARAACAAASLLVSASLSPAAPREARRPEIAPPRPAGRAASRPPLSTAPRPSELPMRFEAGASPDPRVAFTARGQGYTLFLTPGEAVLALAATAAARSPLDCACRDARSGARQGAAPERVLRLRFPGADPKCAVEGVGALPGATSYFVGADPAKWKTGQRAFTRAAYRNLYPGVDAVFYGRGGELEYDFVVGAGADPSRMRLALCGARRLSVDAASGDLVIGVEGGGELRQRRPVAYQGEGACRTVVACRYALLGGGEVGFRLGGFDASKPLVVDPVLAYATYLGGSGQDSGLGVAVDASGAIYLTGSTRSSDFPSATALPGSSLSGVDTYVAKLDATGQNIEYAAVVGGSLDDTPSDCEVDSTGSLCVKGFTASTNFPLHAAAQQSYGGGDLDLFVFKLNPAGTGFVFSTYLGGSGFENCFTGLAVDASDAIYVVTCTSSADFPVHNALKPTHTDGLFDGALVKLTPSGAVVFSTYLGGSGDDSAYEVAVDASGAAYVVGISNSADFPVVGGFQSAPAGDYDATLMKVNPAGSAVVYATFFGGSGLDLASRVAVDDTGAAYVAGRSVSTDLPTKSPFQAASGGGQDAFVFKASPDGSELLFASYFGGSGDESTFGVGVDGVGRMYFAGTTTSTNIPTVDALQAAYGGGTSDVFVAKVDGSGSTLLYSTYYGGSGVDVMDDIAVDANGKVYVTGRTSSPNLATAGPPLYGALDGESDAFALEITDAFEITWEPPDPSAPGSPPRNAEATLADAGSPAKAAAPGAAPAPGALIAYKVYRLPSAGAQPDPSNIFATIPPTQTSTNGNVPGGAVYVVTACYADGSESDPSNGAGAGVGAGPALATVGLKKKSVTATGSNFTDVVQVFVDGIAFASPAAVKKNGTKVVQKGPLVTGQTLKQYLDSKEGPVEIGFRNSDGTASSVAVSR